MLKKLKLQQYFTWIFIGSFLFCSVDHAADYVLHYEKKVTPHHPLKNERDDEDFSEFEKSVIDNNDSFDSTLDFSDDRDNEEDQAVNEEKDEDDDESFSLDQTFKLPKW